MKILGIGEPVIDKVHVIQDCPKDLQLSSASESQNIGGPVLSAFILLSRLNLDCTLLTSLGIDDEAEIIKQKLEEENVKVIANLEDKTKVNTIIINPQNGQREKLRGSIEHSPIKDTPTEFIQQFDLIIMDRHEREAFYEVIHKKKPSAKIVIDPSTEVSDFTLDMMKYADYPILPIESLVKIGKGKELSDCLQILYKICNKPITITAGELGSLIYDGKKLELIPALEIKAIGAFNVSSIEALQAVFEAASEVKVPVIIQTSAGEAEYLLPELVSEICSRLSKIHKVEFILHLDRGNNIDLIKRCLDAGYDSISSEFTSSYDDVIKSTLLVRKLTNQYLAYHEGAIEVVPLRYYKDKYQKELRETDPQLAKKFVDTTGVDSLAVSIGNQSGKLKKKQALDTLLLEKLNDLLLEIPLVLHGGSFLSKPTILQCIQHGVAKININTEIRLAYTDKLKENITKNKDEYAPYRLLKGVKEEMKEIIKNKMILFNGL